MLVISLLILLVSNSLAFIKKNINSISINRIASITLIYSAILSYNSLYFQSIGKGIGISSYLFQNTNAISAMIFLALFFNKKPCLRHGICLSLYPFLSIEKHMPQALSLFYYLNKLEFSIPSPDREGLESSNDKSLKPFPKKSYFKRAIIGLKEGMKLPLLPDHIIKLESHFLIKLFKATGAFSVFLLVSGIAKNFEPIPHYIIFSYSLFFIICILFVVKRLLSVAILIIAYF